MSTKPGTPTQKASEDETGPDAEKNARKRKQRKRQRPNPVELETQRQKQAARRPLARVLNGTKTVFAVGLWSMFSFAHVAVTAPYVSYPYAQSVTVSFVLMAAVLLHLWPTRTPQWRTLFWAYWIFGGVGGLLLYLSSGPMSLTVAWLVTFLFVLIRMNQNGRVLVGLIREWKELR